MGSFRSPSKGRMRFMGRAICAVAAALSLSGSAFAQAQTVWSQLAFGAGGHNLKWTDVAVLPSGKVAACGEEDTANGKDLVIQAWEPDGDVAWIYRYPDPLDETLEYSGKLAVRGNNLLFAGHRYLNASASDTNIFLVELNDSGAQVHIHNYSIDFQSMSDIEQAITVVGTDAYITGRNVGGVNDSYFVLKVDSANAISWIYNPSVTDTVTPLPAKALPNGFIVCGYEFGYLNRQTELKVLNPTTGAVAYSYVPPTSSSDKADFDVTNQNGIVLTYRHSNAGTTRIEQLTDHLVSLGSTDIVGFINGPAEVQDGMTWWPVREPAILRSDAYVPQEYLQPALFPGEGPSPPATAPPAAEPSTVVTWPTIATFTSDAHLYDSPYLLDPDVAPNPVADVAAGTPVTMFSYQRRDNGDIYWDVLTRGTAAADHATWARDQDLAYRRFDPAAPQANLGAYALVDSPYAVRVRPDNVADSNVHFDDGDNPGRPVVVITP